MKTAENTTYTDNSTKESGTRNVTNFSLIVKKLLIEQRKTILFMCGGYLGACLLFGLWSGYLGAAPRNGIFVIYIILSGLTCAIVASKMFYDMTTKEGRISLLMTPGSAAGKYWPRFLAVLPATLALVATGYLVYGYSDLLTLGIIHEQWLALPNPFGNIRADGVAVIGSFMAIFLFNESIFMYGAVAWPKKSFLKSLGVFVIIQISLIVILTAIAKVMIHSDVSVEVVNPNALGWIIIGVVTAVAAGIMYAGFRRFKNSTVI
jgi:hypothetical protein